MEEHLVGWELVLPFASRAAVRSKYVRRAVKFADAIHRPIVRILLEKPELAQGMRMLLTHYQMLDARSADFEDRLVASLRHAVAAPRSASPVR